MFEDLKRDDRFSKLLLPTDSQGALNNLDFRYAACMRMYHTLGQVILNSLTQSSKRVITAALSPKAYSILLSNKNIRNGWDLLWTIFRKTSPHLGGTNVDVHDMITNLKIEPGSTYSYIFADSDSRDSAIFQVYDQFGEHITYPVDDIQSIHEYLDTANLDEAALYPDSTPASGNKAYVQSPSPQPHIARRRVAQYNATHGERPKVPPKASTHPPPVKYPSRSPHQATIPKPNIKLTTISLSTMQTLRFLTS
eukprot:scaffold252323_cov38-Attheya_sp.AAC.2